MREIDKLSLENAKRLFSTNEINNLEIKTLIGENLTNDLSLECIFKDIETSYYYETDEY